MTAPEAHDLAENFVHLLEIMDARLALGQAERLRIVAEIEAGVAPSGYRVDWFLAVTKRIFNLLVVEARLFNAEHPQDRISVQDMLDVLIGAEARLREK